MRGTNVRLVILGALLLVFPGGVSAPPPGEWDLDPILFLWGCPTGFVGDCVLSAETLNATLIFFRFDLDADGRWDSPDPTGAGEIGRWTTQGQVAVRYSEPFRRACAQAWDGFSLRTVDGRREPLGPIGCSDYLRILPSRWSDESQGGSLLVLLSVPAWLDREDFDPRDAEFVGIPALWVPGPQRPAFMFRVDRDAVGQLLGPGTHIVHFAVAWAGRTFSARSEVTIL